MKNLITAVNKVMEEVQNIYKNTTVGQGRSAYKAVKDSDVKETLRPLMTKHGLAIFQTEVNEEVTVERWQEGDRVKQSVMTKVTPKYMLYHVSGECIELMSHGHGIDSQDKSAGKATTYALKQLLLYTFMVTVDNIDDADPEHSDQKPVPKTDNNYEFIQREIKPSELDDGKGWNGKVYKGNIIYINKVGIKLTASQLSTLKKHSRYVAD